MANLSRGERLRIAALRLREIQNEAETIYRTFPELDRRPKVAGPGVRQNVASRWNSAPALPPAKLH